MSGFYNLIFTINWLRLKKYLWVFGYEMVNENYKSNFNQIGAETKYLWFLSDYEKYNG